MNEGHLNALNSRNTYCSCLQVTELFRIRERMQELEKKCDEFADNPPQEQSRLERYQRDYKRTVDELEKTHSDYLSQIQLTARRGEESGKKAINLVLYDLKERKKIRQVDYREAVRCLGLSDRFVILLECDNCNAQLDVLDEVI